MRYQTKHAFHYPMYMNNTYYVVGTSTINEIEKIEGKLYNNDDAKVDRKVFKPSCVCVCICVHLK